MLSSSLTDLRSMDLTNEQWLKNQRLDSKAKNWINPILRISLSFIIIES